MGMLQRTEHLDDEVYRILPCQHLLIVDILLERDAVDILHDDKLELIREADVVHLDDVRMRQECDRLRLIAEAAQEFLILGELLFQDLDGHDLVVHNVSRFVDIGHAADTDQLGNFIPAIQLFTNVLIHCTLQPYFFVIYF